MLKRELRNVFNAKRMALTPEEHATLCTQLCKNFFHAFHDLHAINVLHTFLSIERNKEPDTRLILGRLRTEHPHIKVVIPRVNMQTNEMENFYFEDPGQLKENDWGIPEPVSGTHAPDEHIDMILVPMLAFDLKAQRVGYGKGFYDKFLARCRPDAQRVGLSLFDPVIRIDDPNEHDIPLHFCITPKQVFSFA